MTSHDGRYTISYNGEIYNTSELRSELSNLGVKFRGNSDTEVLVNGISVWGLKPTLKRLNGIFAFAIWDRCARELSLVRDHMGIKPLYWSRQNNVLMFASEIRAFEKLPDFERTLDIEAISNFLQFNYFSSPETIYHNVKALEPGCYMVFSSNGTVRPDRYWSLSQIVMMQHDKRSMLIDPVEAVDTLDTLLKEAVGRQMVSDVPLGAFLSGGIDSSCVTALMQEQSLKPIRTFSIGFDNHKFDEAPAARSIAQHLGTDHTELYVSEQEVIDVVPSLADLFDQPQADTSQLPTYLLCKLARQHVTVALSGDGGDEMYFGYSRFLKANKARSLLGNTPLSCRRVLASTTNHYATPNMPPPRGRLSRAHWQIARMMHFAQAEVDDVYMHFQSSWIDPSELIEGTQTNSARWTDSKLVSSDFNERMMYHDSSNYLIDDVLVKVDRASMAASMEVRVPYLDPSIVQHAWGLPFSLKYRDGMTKWCLREVLHRRVPKALVDQPKRGFGAPMDKWLRGPLRDWGESLLSETALKNTNLLNSSFVRKLWTDMQQKQFSTPGYIWSVLMLQAWLLRS